MPSISKHLSEGGSSEETSREGTSYEESSSKGTSGEEERTSSDECTVD